MLGLAGGAGFFSTVTYEANIPQIDRVRSRIIFARNRAGYNLKSVAVEDTGARFSRPQNNKIT
jgi:hypothetical protein